MTDSHQDLQASSFENMKKLFFVQYKCEILFKITGVNVEIGN